MRSHQNTSLQQTPTPTSRLPKYRPFRTTSRSQTCHDRRSKDIVLFISTPDHRKLHTAHQRNGLACKQHVNSMIDPRTRNNHRSRLYYTHRSVLRPTFKNTAKDGVIIGGEIPATIVLPRTKEDVHKVVQWAVKPSIPFVTKSGGCSEWSTMGGNGLVIDLTHYPAIEVDAKARPATTKGGVTQKEAAVRLAEAGPAHRSVI